MNRLCLRHPECTPKWRAPVGGFTGVHSGSGQAVEQGHAVGEEVLTVLENGERATHGEIHAALFAPVESSSAGQRSIACGNRLFLAR